MSRLLRLVVQPRKVLRSNEAVQFVRSIVICDESGAFLDRFSLLAASMEDDIQTATGSGATALREIARIEAGGVAKIESDGNAWVTHIAPDKVWFESLYGQGEGGEVSFAQYKLAVQTYVRFLGDPESKPIEVPFPLE